MTASEVDSYVAIAGANSPTDLWRDLASSKDVQSEITRFNCTNGFYYPDGGSRKGLTNVKMAYRKRRGSTQRFHG